MSETLLYSLLVASIVASVLLAAVSMAMVGRKIADLEYQQSLGVNGTAKIQSIVNIRTHALRTGIGLTFIVISALLLADAPVLWRSWVNRILFVALPSAYAVASVLDWLAERQQIRLQTEQIARNRQIAAGLAIADEHQRTAALRADHDSYKEMAAEAIASLAIMAGRARAESGEIPPPLVAVVPEHNSPVTAEQQADADRQTMRAKLVASKLALGLPAREAATPEDPPQTPVPESVDIVTIQKDAADAIADAVQRASQDAAKEGH